MLANKESWEDIKKYYLGTYVKFREEGDALFYIDRVDPEKIVAKAINGDLVGIDLETGYHLDYVIPKKTVFQYGNVVAMLSRVPARMWKKGMSKENTRFEIFGVTGKWDKCAFDPKLIEAFINKPGYYEPKDAIKELTSTTSIIEACALNPRMTLSKTGKLLVDQTIVGKLDFNKNIMAIKPLFKNEAVILFPGVTLKEVK